MYVCVRFDHVSFIGHTHGALVYIDYKPHLFLFPFLRNEWEYDGVATREWNRGMIPPSPRSPNWPGKSLRRARPLDRGPVRHFLRGSAGPGRARHKSRVLAPEAHSQCAEPRERPFLGGEQERPRPVRVIANAQLVVLAVAPDVRSPVLGESPAHGGPGADGAGPPWYCVHSSRLRMGLVAALVDVMPAQPPVGCPPYGQYVPARGQGKSVVVPARHLPGAAARGEGRSAVSSSRAPERKSATHLRGLMRWGKKNGPSSRVASWP